MKRIAIIGSTGSIGRQALEVIDCHIDQFDVVALAAGAKNLVELAQQVAKYSPQVVAVPDSDSAMQLRRLLREDNDKAIVDLTKIEILTGEEGLISLATHSDVELVLTGIVGSAGVKPTYAAVKSNKTIALANKETLVAAGCIIMPLAKASGAKIIPVDSEHSAIFQCLQGNQLTDVRKIWLTASGGPFRTWTKEQIERATIGDALRHPNWTMGKKITIDSATLMNKGLELIEAHWLFNCPASKIKVVIHPQSILHSAVEFCDYSIIGQFGLPDMRLPIHYALFYPERVEFPNGPSLDLYTLRQLSFEEPDYDRFPCLKLAQEVAEQKTTMAAVLNAANEAIVEAFLSGSVRFKDIPDSLKRVLDKHKANSNPDLEDILEADCWARREAAEVIKSRV